MKNCITLGHGAIAEKPYELVICCQLDPALWPETMRTTMTPDEYPIVLKIFARLIADLHEGRNMKWTRSYPNAPVPRCACEMCQLARRNQ